MSMWFLPSHDQWRKWSLPSKLTAIGAYAGIIGIPLAVVLFALSIFLQGRSSPASSDSQVTAKPLVAERPRPKNTAAKSVKEQSIPTSGMTARDTATRSGDFLAGLIADLKSNDLTGLQKSQIRRRLVGQRVQWSGHVRETTSFSSGNSEVFLLIWTPAAQVNASFPDALVATFSTDQAIELNALRKNDLVVIEGTVDFTEQGLDAWVPKLRESRLLSVKTNR